MRRLAALAAVALALAGCGSISLAQSTRDWLSQSNFSHSRSTLLGDVRHAQSALREPDSSGAALHTVCAVLLLDAEAANSALPSPDHQATGLLATAYASMGAGANTCYGAHADAPARARALAYLRQSLAQFSFAVIRLQAASAT